MTEIKKNFRKLCNKVINNYSYDPGVTWCVLTTLTGIILRHHCGALIPNHTNSDNSEIVGTSRLEIVEQEGVVLSQIGALNVGHAEVVLTMVHVQRKRPGKGDGAHSLRLHRDGARRVGN